MHGICNLASKKYYLRLIVNVKIFTSTALLIIYTAVINNKRS
ncbi:hypothetical protein BH09PAT3_BH09PAT3_1720 [soil metagenome]